MVAGERASAHDEPIPPTDQDDATIVLHVVSYAALPGDILNGAKGRVEMVYERIGVRILWVDSDRAAKKHQDGGLHLTVMLLSRDMVQKKTLADGISDSALGQAHFASGRAHIFCDRIVTMPGANPLAIKLGAVIAHEGGHLVLPENSHSRSGVMRADMDAQARHSPAEFRQDSGPYYPCGFEGTERSTVSYFFSAASRPFERTHSSENVRQRRLRTEASSPEIFAPPRGPA